MPDETGLGKTVILPFPLITAGQLPDAPALNRLKVRIPADKYNGELKMYGFEVIPVIETGVTPSV